MVRETHPTPLVPKLHLGTEMAAKLSLAGKAFPSTVWEIEKERPVGRASVPAEHPAARDGCLTNLNLKLGTSLVPKLHLGTGNSRQA